MSIPVWFDVPASYDRWWVCSSRLNECQGKRKCSEKTCPVPTVHHKSHMTWPGLEEGSSWCESGDQPFISFGLHIVLLYLKFLRFCLSSAWYWKVWPSLKTFHSEFINIRDKFITSTARNNLYTVMETKGCIAATWSTVFSKFRTHDSQSVFVPSYYLFLTTCLDLNSHQQVYKIVNENCCSVVTLLHCEFYEQRICL
jgi:hypothetical protein